VKGEYEHGDLSGPAVEQSLVYNVRQANLMRSELDDTRVMISSVVKSIVGDEIEEITEQLLQWSGKNGYPASCDVIFTTGGTGFSPRDVTPEATQEVIEKEASGLMTFVTAQCARIQPLAALSRGKAGICGETIIVNLPGNPGGVGQVLDVLVPLLLYAIKDLKGL
jgi:gephyrin